MLCNVAKMEVDCHYRRLLLLWAAASFRTASCTHGTIDLEHGQTLDTCVTLIGGAFQIAAASVRVVQSGQVSRPPALGHAFCATQTSLLEAVCIPKQWCIGQETRCVDGGRSQLSTDSGGMRAGVTEGMKDRVDGVTARRPRRAIPSSIWDHGAVGSGILTLTSEFIRMKEASRRNRGRRLHVEWRAPRHKAHRHLCLCPFQVHAQRPGVVTSSDSWAAR